jgi:hypothetical protein
VSECKALPTILATRTLSTLKPLAFLGHTSMDASAHVAASSSSYPNCFDDSVPFPQGQILVHAFA